MKRLITIIAFSATSCSSVTKTAEVPKVPKVDSALIKHQLFMDSCNKHHYYYSKALPLIIDANNCIMDCIHAKLAGNWKKASRLKRKSDSLHLVFNVYRDSMNMYN